MLPAKIEQNDLVASDKRENTEQTEITEDTETCRANNVPSILLFLFVPCPHAYLGIVFTCLFTVLAHTTFAQQAQNPSPMVEHTRTHPRLTQTTPAGRRVPLRIVRSFCLRR